MFHVHAHHQTPFWWRHFAKFPAPAASDTQQKGPSDSGHIATKATNPRWSGSATRKACDSFSGPSVLLCLVLFHPFWFLFNPSVRRLEGDNFKLKIPPFSWEKLGSQRKLPLILLLPRLLCDKAAHLRRRPFWGMTPRLGLTWFKRAADGDSCWWMGKAMGRTHQQSWINMNIVGISLAISKMRAMNID